MANSPCQVTHPRQQKIKCWHDRAIMKKWSDCLHGSTALTNTPCCIPQQWKLKNHNLQQTWVKNWAQVKCMYIWSNCLNSYLNSHSKSTSSMRVKTKTDQSWMNPTRKKASPVYVWGFLFALLLLYYKSLYKASSISYLLANHRGFRGSIFSSPM